MRVLGQAAARQPPAAVRAAPRSRQRTAPAALHQLRVARHGLRPRRTRRGPRRRHAARSRSSRQSAPAHGSRRSRAPRVTRRSWAGGALAVARGTEGRGQC